MARRSKVLQQAERAGAAPALLQDRGGDGDGPGRQWLPPANRGRVGIRLSRPQSPGAAKKHPFGDDVSELADYAWFDKNSGDKTHPVGQKKPNRWGLFDMQGNVYEWCQDGYSEVYYQFSPDADPPGPAEASSRVIRGGSWSSFPWLCRPAGRNGVTPGLRSNGLGFRVAAVQE